MKTLGLKSKGKPTILESGAIKAARLSAAVFKTWAIIGEEAWTASLPMLVSLEMTEILRRFISCIGNCMLARYRFYYGRVYNLLSFPQ